MVHAGSRGLVPPENPVVEAAEAAVEGAEVELSCAVPRSRPPATLRWYREKREIHGEGGGGDSDGDRVTMETRRDTQGPQRVPIGNCKDPIESPEVLMETHKAP